MSHLSSMKNCTTTLKLHFNQIKTPSQQFWVLISKLLVFFLVFFFFFFLHKPLTLLHPSYFPSRSVDIAKIGFLHFPLSTVSCVLCCSSSRSFQTNFPQSYPVIFGIFGNFGTLKKKIGIVYMNLYLPAVQPSISP